MSGRHRWNGYTHQELYEKINVGPGPSASEASADRWLAVARALTVISADVQRAIAKSGPRWTGAAADGTRAGLQPLGQWAIEARGSAETMRAAAERQAENISKARADMPAPVAAPTGQPTEASGLSALFSGQIDFEIREALSEAAEERAFEVMTNYEISTAGITGSLTPFTRPPDVVIAPQEIVRGDGAYIPSARSGTSTPTGRGTPATRRAPTSTRAPGGRAPASRTPASGAGSERRAVTRNGPVTAPRSGHVGAPAQHGAAPQGTPSGAGSASPQQSAPRAALVSPTSVSLGGPTASIAPSAVVPTGWQAGAGVAVIPQARVDDEPPSPNGHPVVEAQHRYLESTGDMFGESFLVSPPVLGAGPA
ncbi:MULTISPECIES: PPE domain-containing protein [Actinoalloteichus]|uniref:PPE family protein n=1 Tax=Actinoalloteichus fjordicus TaxID=1612552 RepID=A0AAC9LGY0_9PSEU|nr:MULTISPECIES: PPE domain-containing protein [Actinoalloteichus]APU17397.1 PPE family protein [Actinoalloteichus fjordicus]APU23481.1 PPE family protein [Actinoalloteichus sp. GBA129-24]